MASQGRVQNEAGIPRRVSLRDVPPHRVHHSYLQRRKHPRPSNGGQTWTPVTDPCHAIRSVHFVTPDLGYAVFGGGQTDSTMVRLDGGVPAVPGGGTLLRTSDGGRTWLAVPGSPAGVQTVCFMATGARR